MLFVSKDTFIQYKITVNIICIVIFFGISDTIMGFTFTEIGKFNFVNKFFSLHNILEQIKLTMMDECNPVTAVTMQESEGRKSYKQESDAEVDQSIGKCLWPHFVHNFLMQSF